MAGGRRPKLQVVASQLWMMMIMFFLFDRQKTTFLGLIRFRVRQQQQQHHCVYQVPIIIISFSSSGWAWEWDRVEQIDVCNFENAVLIRAPLNEKPMMKSHSLNYHYRQPFILAFRLLLVLESIAGWLACPSKWDFNRWCWTKCDYIVSLQLLLFYHVQFLRSAFWYQSKIGRHSCPFLVCSSSIFYLFNCNLNSWCVCTLERNC